MMHLLKMLRSTSASNDALVKDAAIYEKDAEELSLRGCLDKIQVVSKRKNMLPFVRL